MVIDFHTHIFPEKVAAKAMQVLVRNCGLPPFYDGTKAGLDAQLDAAGIDLAVNLPIVTSPDSAASINQFAAKLNQQNKRILSFGGLHPRDPHFLQVIDQITALGLKGIKMHPDYQDFFVDDERVFPVYEAIFAKGLILSFHSGYDIGLPEPVHCTPKRLARVLDRFEGQGKIVAAHMGGAWYDAKQALNYLCGRQVYFDTSFALGDKKARLATPQGEYTFMSDELFMRMVEKHDAERILFGSDGPWSDARLALARLRSLPLSEQELRRITWANAADLLDLDENDLATRREQHV